MRMSLTILMILVALDETLDALPALTTLAYPESTSNLSRSLITHGTSRMVENVESRSIQKKKEKR